VPGAQFASASLWMAIGVGLSCAQSQPVQAPEAVFEAASIKPARPGARGYSIGPLPGLVSAENVTLKVLIGDAVRGHDFQVSGGPSGSTPIATMWKPRPAAVSRPAGNS